MVLVTLGSGNCCQSPDVGSAAMPLQQDLVATSLGKLPGFLLQQDLVYHHCLDWRCQEGKAFQKRIRL